MTVLPGNIVTINTVSADDSTRLRIYESITEEQPAVITALKSIITTL